MRAAVVGALLLLAATASADEVTFMVGCHVKENAPNIVVSCPGMPNPLDEIVGTVHAPTVAPGFEGFCHGVYGVAQCMSLPSLNEALAACNRHKYRVCVSDLDWRDLVDDHAIIVSANCQSGTHLEASEWDHDFAAECNEVKKRHDAVQAAYDEETIKQVLGK